LTNPSLNRYVSTLAYHALGASSKAYRIYIKEDCCIEVRMDVIFDDNIACKRSKDIPMILMKNICSKPGENPSKGKNQEIILLFL